MQTQSGKLEFECNSLKRFHDPERPRAVNAAVQSECRALALQLPPAERPEVLWRGCTADDGVSCLFLAELVAGGAPLPKASRGDVAWLRAQACDLQLNYACASHRW